MPAVPRRLRAAPEAIPIVCFSRCMWCGRQTPHEVCHEHSTAIHGHGNVRFDWETGDMAGWSGYYLPPEVCEDPECPQRRKEEVER